MVLVKWPPRMQRCPRRREWVTKSPDATFWEVPIDLAVISGETLAIAAAGGWAG